MANVITITAADLIRRSMYLISAVAAGEVLDDMTANDALSTLNEMIDSWSTENLAVYGSDRDEFTLTPGKSMYTWGVGGDWAGQRPVNVTQIYTIRQGITYPVHIINVGEYVGIALKAQSDQLVNRVYISQSYPLTKVSVYPVPTEANVIGFVTGRVLDVIPSLSTVLEMPPGYIRALRYCLAVDLWAEYPSSSVDINTVKAIALKAKANIKTANMQDILMNFDDVPDGLV